MTNQILEGPQMAALSLRIGPNLDARPPVPNPIPQNMQSYRALACEWLKQNRKRWSPSTEARYTEAVDRFCMWLGDQTITRDVINRYLSETVKSWETACRTMRVLRNVLQLAVDMGIADHNPAEKIKLKYPKPAFKRDTFSKAEYLRMKEATRGRRLYAPIVIGYATGMRISDVVYLKWENIDFNTQMIRCVPIKTRRRGSVMEQPIPSGSDLLEVLLALRESSDGVSEYVFPQYHRDPNRQLRTNYLMNDMREMLKRLGIKGKSFHTFRRTFLTNLASSGCDTIMAMHMAGLTSPNTLRHYVVPSADAMRIALAKAKQFGDNH